MLREKTNYNTQFKVPLQSARSQIMSTINLVDGLQILIVHSFIYIKTWVHGRNNNFYQLKILSYFMSDSFFKFVYGVLVILFTQSLYAWW